MRSEKEVQTKLKEVESWSLWKKAFVFGWYEYRRTVKVLKWVLEEEKK